jgi:hypothetical protein
MALSTSIRILLTTLLGSSLGIAAASAADLPVKAPPPSPLDQLDVHGYFNMTYMNDYVTGNGLLVSKNGLTSHYVAGLVFDLYKDKFGFINDVSLDIGTYNNLYSLQNDTHVGAWNEFDWWAAINVTFAKSWTLGVEYIEFLFPAPDLWMNPPGIERNLQFSLSYNDAWTGWPVTFNPYVKLWDHASGPSNVVLGDTSDALEVFLGMAPTIDLMKYAGVPITLSAPTSFTVGPTSFWNKNNGTTNFCAPLSNGGFTAGSPTAPCALSNFGYFTTGLTGVTPLNPLIPKRLGTWNLKYGFQYYHIINDALLAAQEFTAGASGNSNMAGTFNQTERDIFVGFVGMALNF